MGLPINAFTDWPAYLAAHGAAERAKAEQRESRIRALAAGDYSRFLGAPDYSPYRKVLARPGKCESCGSREFKEHGGQTVCAYCRSGA